MLRITVLSTLMLIFLAACGGQGEQPVLPTATPVPPTWTPGATMTPRLQASPTPATTKTSSPDDEPTSEPTGMPLPDFSGVELYEVTHLMDPRLFQVSMDGWPTDVPDDLIVRVGLEIYNCDILFPERFPNRVYCWGLAPPRGTEVTLQVILENVTNPLLEIPFVVPYPSNQDS